MTGKIIVVTDGSKQAKNALELGADIASKYDAKIYLVHTVDEAIIGEDLKKFMESEGIEGSPEEIYIQTFGQAIINEALRVLYDHGALNIESTILPGKPAREIINFAREKSADMIVIWHNGWGKTHEIYRRRVTRKVSRFTHCTLISVNG